MYNNKRLAFAVMLLLSFSVLYMTAVAAPSIKEAGFYKCGNSFTGMNEPALSDSNSLKQALADFLAKVDSGKSAAVIAYYDNNFLSVRVVDAGQFIRMDYTQMVNFWKSLSARQPAANGLNYKAITTQSTTIHYIEVLGDTAYVLLTRVKDLGNGPEPMFYNLVWVSKNNKWYLFREIVHQRTLPNFH
jgi:hypothetical protein